MVLPCELAFWEQPCGGRDQPNLGIVPSLEVIGTGLVAVHLVTEPDLPFALNQLDNEVDAAGLQVIKQIHAEQTAEREFRFLEIASPAWAAKVKPIIRRVVTRTMWPMLRRSQQFALKLNLVA